MDNCCHSDKTRVRSEEELRKLCNRLSRIERSEEHTSELQSLYS